MSQKSKASKNIFSRRLKEARQKTGLSQKRLGIAAGIDEFVASTRINRYEQGVHEPDVQTASRLAKVLKVPLAYLFAEEDQLATIILEFDHLAQEALADTTELLLLWKQLPRQDQKKLIAQLQSMTETLLAQ